jgi:DeoR/GlpR family transcriptional regulator of sugar metabolism
LAFNKNFALLSCINLQLKPLYQMEGPLTMLKKERHAFIIKQINLHNKVLSSDLSIQLRVSEDTVRRDLIELAEKGKIVKVHGGALCKTFHFPFQHLEVYGQSAKKIIAMKALSLIKDGMNILTGGGTTMLELARLIPDTTRATFFTVSPLVALELSEHPNLTVVQIGGRFSKNAQVVLGAEVISFLSEIKVDLCFLGTNGIGCEEGITDSDWDVVQLKKAMVKAASKLYVLCISEKLNSVKPMKVCNLNQIAGLITELNPESQVIQSYSSNGLVVA